MQAVLRDNDWFDDVYATLVSWGMHRMGPGNVKLRDIAELRESVLAQEEDLRQLDGIRINAILPSNVGRVTDAVWSVLSNLRVSVADSRLVANSKTLHHLLPGLIPPIDREYTYRFFYNRKNLTITEQAAFKEMFSQFVHIATDSADTIEARIGIGWNTSASKVVDNAIIGYRLDGRDLAK